MGGLSASLGQGNDSVEAGGQVSGGVGKKSTKCVGLGVEIGLGSGSA